MTAKGFIKGLVRRMGRDERGATSIVIALTLIPLVGCAGLAIAVARAHFHKAKLQNSVDAAALAAAKLPPTATDAQVMASAKAFIAANYGREFNLVFLTRADNDGRLGMAATATIPTSLMAVLGQKSMTVKAEGWVAAGDAAVELVMALDNSGSMSGSDIMALRSAAKDLATTILDLPGDKSKVGVVPFAALVNVGPANASASWIDKDAKSPVHSENFDKSTSRLDLYDQMKGVSWGGCVESRPWPYDVTDDAPLPGTPATLFVPSFAPDEPDGILSGFNNSYVSDVGGSCKNTSIWDSNERKQERTCKYSNVTPLITLVSGSRYGPNQMCDSAPLQRLSKNKSSILSAISKMEAYGGTNLVEGFTWAWRALSPKAPFADGVAYGEKGYKKVVVLMTDGENQILGSSNMNLSRYSSYGYASSGRLGVKSSSADRLKQALDERLSLACGNAKAAGVDVYTVTFGVSDASTRSLMQSCATSTSFAFFPTTGSGLGEAFAAIGKSVGDLRLVQ